MYHNPFCEMRIAQSITLVITYHTFAASSIFTPVVHDSRHVTHDSHALPAADAIQVAICSKNYKDNRRRYANIQHTVITFALPNTQRAVLHTKRIRVNSRAVAYC